MRDTRRRYERGSWTYAGGNKAMRVLCMIPAMAGPGGAERTMSYLLAHLAERHAVTLLTLEQPDAAAFYPLPDSLQQVRIDKLGGRGIKRLVRVLSRPFRIRREVRASAPDVIVSFMDTMNTTALIGCLGLGIAVIVSERIDPSKHQIGWAKNVARASIYPFARFIVVQTKRVANYFPKLQPQVRIVANPVPIALATTRAGIPNSNGRKRIIGVGRLESQKGFDRLIDAFALIAGSRTDWDLTVIGEGPERPRLETQVRRYGLEERINLVGVVSDVFQELAASHLMAFPSLYEGFPNALAEAMAAGLPAVGNVGVSGVDELIINGETGFLVDPKSGPVGLARALAELMDDAPCRDRFGEAARQHVLQWNPEPIFGLWDELLAEATGELIQ